MSLESNSAKIAQLKAKIESLPKAPAGSITITSNGTYDVKEKASAIVNVAGSTSGGSAIAGITELETVSFTCEQTATGNGEEVYNYVGGYFTLPDDYFTTCKYKIIFPFKTNITNESEYTYDTVGLIVIDNYAAGESGSIDYHGLIELGQDNIQIFGPNIGEPTAEIPAVVDIFTNTDGTKYGIDLYVLSTAFTTTTGIQESPGSYTYYIPQNCLENIHPLLISYDELNNGGGGGQQLTYSITNNLLNCSSNNSTHTIIEGNSYSAIISSSPGYTLDNATCSILMGETDITAQVYNNGIISIPNVTGNIQITITAVADSLVSTFGIKDSTKVSIDDGTEINNVINVCLIGTNNYITLKKGHRYFISNCNLPSSNTSTACPYAAYLPDGRFVTGAYAYHNYNDANLVIKNVVRNGVVGVLFSPRTDDDTASALVVYRLTLICSDISKITITEEEFSNTVLLLHADDFTDSSVAAHTLTNHGVSLSTKKKFGTNSFEFDGSSCINISPIEDIDFGTGDWTVEAFVRRNKQLSDSFIFSGAATGAMFVGLQLSGSKLKIGVGRAGVAWDAITSLAWEDNATDTEWNHIAVVKYNNFITFYVDGEQIGSPVPNKQSYSMLAAECQIGAQGENYYYNGYLDEIRISNCNRYLFSSEFENINKPFTY